MPDFFRNKKIEQRVAMLTDHQPDGR